MKECPVCKAKSFVDDMEVCFGCMHRFDGGPEAAPEPDASVRRRIAEISPWCHKFCTCAPDEVELLDVGREGDGACAWARFRVRELTFEIDFGRHTVARVADTGAVRSYVEAGVCKMVPAKGGPR